MNFMAQSYFTKGNKNHMLRNSEIETISYVFLEFLNSLNVHESWLDKIKIQLEDINRGEYLPLTTINFDKLIPAKMNNDFVDLLKGLLNYLRQNGDYISKDYLNSFYERGPADRAGYTMDLPITFFENHINKIICLFEN